uniref:NACHT, LRR and PYD domains-containing protein 13-like n=1 Tax=Phallusia mammillata TaxID=59560 RepID=A0A6F9DN77_9ASCI|nr:NACHT, LRR and PYD domains-containing protein 13-like [Phallusia mammillata]
MKKNQDVQKLDDLFKFHQDVSSEVSQGIVAFEQLTGTLASINTETSPPLTYNRNNLQPVMKIKSNQMSQHDKGKLDTETEDLDIEKINTEEMGNEDHKLEDDVPEITEEELKQEFQLFWSTRKTIGKDGGTIQVASCEVEIPPDALENNVEIEIAAFDCRKNKKLMHLTPLLQCKPHGLKFNKVVKITLPTGRSAERKYSFIVRKLKTWNKYVIIGSGTTTSDKSFRFTVDRFSIYDVVPLGVQEYIGWRKEITLVLAVTPDANEEPQQIDAHVLLSNNTEVALDGLKQVIETTFPVLYSDQNLSLQVTGEDININPNDANKVERVWERS